jgi:hypothetical protein
MNAEPGKKKPSALIAIAFGSKKKGAEGEGGDEYDDAPDSGEMDTDAEGEKAAADEVWSAIEAKDKDAFTDALGRYVRLCKAAGEKDEE